MLNTLPDKVRDPGRLAALRRTALLDSPAEAAFDRLTRLASRLLQAPVVLVSLVDVDRQFFKSAVGLPEPWASRRETPLSHSFCQYVVQSGEELLIEDATDHPLVCTNLAVPEIGVIAYAGMPLVTSDGHVLGSFCAIDNQPRTWQEDEINLLRDLAASVITEIELRMAAQAAEQEMRAWERALARLRQSEEQMRAILDNTSALVYIKDREGRFLLVNDRFSQVIGRPKEQILGKTDFDLYPFDVARAFYENDRVVFETDRSYQIEETFPQEGGLHTYVSSKVPLHDTSGAVYALCGVSADITVQKRLEADLAAALAKDHQIATTLQDAFLINYPQDVFPGLSLATFYEPAWDEANVGGDFFDVYALEDSLVALVVGDLGGKGLAAAIHTAEIKYALRAFLREDPDPATALQRLNRFVCAAPHLDHPSPGEEVLLTLAIVVVNTQTGVGRAATAGAEPPLVVRHDGEAEALETRGLLLGVSPEALYTATSLSLDTEDIVVMTTDGVTEARRGLDLFGYERMTDVARWARPLGLRPMGQAILDGARTFAGGSLQDDVCLLVVQRR